MKEQAAVFCCDEVSMLTRAMGVKHAYRLSEKRSKKNRP